jgi:cell shape-determining protein MreD
MWILMLLFAGFVGFISATPFIVPILVYLGIFLLSKVLNIWVWQTPLLAMFLLTFVGTLLQHVIYLIVLWVTETPFDWTVAFANVTLPSVLLNMLLAIPVHALVQEMARSVYPIGLES